jgi:hypothetical protein
VDPHPAVAARIEAHPFEQAPGRRLPRTERLGLPAQGAQSLSEVVANAFERTEVQQAARGAGPTGRRCGQMGEAGAHGRTEPRLEPRDLIAKVAAGPGLVDLGERDLRRDAEPAFALEHGHRQPPIGARGFAPQKSWVPSMPTRCTSTMFSTIDFAVARPTPTGPPDA